MNDKIKHLCYCGLMTALVTLCTMAIPIPVPGTGGYIHPGDSVILLAGYFFGRKYGAAAGGIGSALADLLLGYAYWAPFTLVIKAAMGFVMGAISDSETPVVSPRNAFAAFACEAVMLVGYFLSGAMMEGFAAAVSSVPSNMIQAVGGIIIFAALAAAFKKAGIMKLVK